MDLIYANGSFSKVAFKSITVNDVSPLHAIGQPTTTGSGLPPLTENDLQAIVAEAITRWADTGLDAPIIAKLAQVEFMIDDLTGSRLGVAAGNRVTLDVNAAGYGWFVDPTPTMDEEFVSSGSHQSLQAVDPRAVDRIDLLSVVEHELGHIIGLENLDDMTNSLMSGVLGTGIRRHIG